MFKLTVIRDSEVDNYENGCDPYSFESYQVERSEYSNLDKLLLDIHESYVKYYNSPHVYIEKFDDRLIVQRQENADGHKPNDEELEAFKAGKLNLYAVTYNFYITEVITKDIDLDSLCSKYKIACCE